MQQQGHLMLTLRWVLWFNGILFLQDADNNPSKKTAKGRIRRQFRRIFGLFLAVSRKKNKHSKQLKIGEKVDTENVYYGQGRRELQAQG